MKATHRIARAVVALALLLSCSSCYVLVVEKRLDKRIDELAERVDRLEAQAEPGR